MGAKQSAPEQYILVRLPPTTWHAAHAKVSPSQAFERLKDPVPFRESPKERDKKRWDITQNSILPWLVAHSFKTDKTVWGGVTWNHIHERSICFPDDPTLEEQEAERQYLMLLFRSLPCPECRGHASTYAQTNPPTLETSSSYQNWGFEFHNSVNARLGKATMSREDFNETYRDMLVREQHC